MKRYVPAVNGTAFMGMARTVSQDGPGWGPSDKEYVVASDAEAEIEKARRDGREQGAFECKNAAGIARYDERERLKAEFLAWWKGEGAYAGLGRSFGSFIQDLFGPESRPTPEPAPLEKLSQIAGPEYTYESSVRLAINALVDHVKALEGRKV